MVQNNKVLTVSYGTFSCTLEGFEDSFGTMKAIAEYFRDLASDDRYFGAEPPQPDADMLARIAQREIARQVEARSGDGGIHLRAAAAEAAREPPVPTSTALTAAPSEPSPDLSTSAPSASDPSASDQEKTPADQGDSPAQTASEAVAPAPVTLQSAPSPDEAGAETAAEDEDEETAAAITAEETEFADSEAFLWGVNTTLTATDEADEPAEEQIEPRSETSEDEDIRAEAVATAPRREDTVPASDSIAAKLQRIRAVVAKTPTEEEDFTEDEHAESFLTDESAALEHVLSDDADVAFQDAAPQDAAPRETEADPLLLEDALEEGEESVSDVLDRLNLTGRRPAAQADPEEVTQETAVDATEDTSDEDHPSEDPAAQHAPRAADPETPAAAAAPQADSDTGTETNSEITPAPGPVTPRRPVRGRVIRVKRAQVDANLIEATAEDVAETPTSETAPAAEPAPSTPPARRGSLSEDDEADLMAELAAVEAELMASSGDIDDDSSDTGTDRTTGDADDEADEEDAQARPPARDILTAGDHSPDGDLSRLMAAADDRLSDEDATTSRETYNQLRAAVAAAQADTDGSDEARREARTQAFRADLASVVRPHSGTDATTEHPREGPRPAPLKLVAEQRIDATPKSRPAAPARPVPTPTGETAAPSTPIRPRRVSSTLLQGEEEEVSPRGDDSAFATYASDKGAVELQELLEAAASYMSFVEGRESFSRPQLINKVRMLDGQDDFNREDSLRSFGQLLREGKLKKASNGRFSVSSQIGFRPGNRAAG